MTKLSLSFDLGRPLRAYRSYVTPIRNGARPFVEASRHARTVSIPLRAVRGGGAGYCPRVYTQNTHTMVNRSLPIPRTRSRV